MSNEKRTTDCGLNYAHSWHLYKTERGKKKVCDGSLDKARDNDGKFKS
jgi:hypothetical protein